jgi:patatin-like phospholipase/acyl hydrolase
MNNMKNKILNVSHPVPPNEYGIFMMHCQDNQPFTDDEYQSIIDGPIKAIEPTLQEELSKVVMVNEFIKNTGWSKLGENILPTREINSF